MDKSDKRAVTSPVNGNKGIGPNTEEGKAIASQNSTKHGIFSKFTTKFDIEVFDDVYAKFATEFSDHSETRKLLITQLTVLKIRLDRCRKFEQEKFRAAVYPDVIKKTLVKRGTPGFDFNVGLDLGTPDEYKYEVVEQGEHITTSSKAYEELEPVLMKYESHFLSQFVKIVEILSNTKN